MPSPVPSDSESYNNDSSQPRTVASLRRRHVRVFIPIVRQSSSGCGSRNFVVNEQADAGLSDDAR